MAIVHKATLIPSKQELVAAWLPGRGWSGGRSVADKVAEYRFDDPAGEVGVETILWRCDDGALVQTPLTYRGAPLAGAEDHLVGTTDHSVLGPRWVYDGVGDPVWAATLAAAIATGGRQAAMVITLDGAEHEVPARMRVRGSGSSATGPAVDAVDEVRDEGDVTVVRCGAVELRVARVPGGETRLEGTETLTGQVGDDTTTLTLASLTT